MVGLADSHGTLLSRMAQFPAQRLEIVQARAELFQEPLSIAKKRNAELASPTIKPVDEPAPQVISVAEEGVHLLLHWSQWK